MVYQLAKYRGHSARHSPPRKGRGQGYGLYIIHSQDVRDPTPTPPLKGRGAAAHCFWVVFWWRRIFGVDSYMEIYQIVLMVIGAITLV